MRVLLENFRDCGHMDGEMAGNVGQGDLNQGEGIYSLIDTLGDQNEFAERIRAAKALGQSRDPRAISPLIGCLKDVDPRLRRCCAEALLKHR